MLSDHFSLPLPPPTSFSRQSAAGPDNDLDLLATPYFHLYGLGLNTLPGETTRAENRQIYCGEKLTVTVFNYW